MPSPKPPSGGIGTKPSATIPRSDATHRRLAALVEHRPPDALCLGRIPPIDYETSITLANTSIRGYTRITTCPSNPGWFTVSNPT